MFARFRRYQKAIWLAIIIVIVPGFVLIVSSVSDIRIWGQLLAELPGFKSLAPQEPVQFEFGSIGGRPIQRDDFVDAWKEVSLGYLLQRGQWPTSDDEPALRRETVSRLFILQKVRELGIQVSDVAVGQTMRDWIRDMPRDEFVRQYLAERNLTWEDFERFARHETMIRQLIGVAGLSGKLLDPKEGLELFHKDHEQFHVSVAVFWASNYLDQAIVSDEQVARFYTNRMAQYRIPERVQVSYVVFPASNYWAEADAELAKATDLEARVDAVYRKLGGTNYFKDASGRPLPEAEAKQKIKQENRLRLALREAHRKAAEFGNELYNLPQTNSLEKFEKFAAAKGVPVHVTPPFDRVEGPGDTNLPPELVDVAFKLARTPAEPISFRPLVGENGVYLVAFNKLIPSETPPLEKVRDKVTADCKFERALELARQAGTNFANLVATNLGQGKPFAQLAAEAKVPVIKLPPITPSSTSWTNVDERLSLNEVQRWVLELQPGQATRFVPNLHGGWVAHLDARTPPTPAQIQAELPQYMATLRRYRVADAFNQWFAKQAELAQVSVPREPTNATPRAPRGARPGR